MLGRWFGLKFALQGDRMDLGMLLMFLFFPIIFVGAALIVNKLLMPSHPSIVKNMTYECGIEEISEGVVKYNIRFYVFALIYAVFSVEAAFLFPWAVVYKTLPGIMPTVEVVIFIFILTLGLAYAWKKGALKWD